MKKLAASQVLDGPTRAGVRCARPSSSLWTLVGAFFAFSSDTKQDVRFIAAPGAIDRDPDPAIEDYILALPPYAFHEESVAHFTARVRTARGMPQNEGAAPDHLFCGGDGGWSARAFVLDRATRRLEIHVCGGPEPGAKPYTTVLRRVPGGWIWES